MTDSLTTRIEKALAITREATPGPWEPRYWTGGDRQRVAVGPEHHMESHGTESDARAIVLWRAIAEQALELAKASKQYVDCFESMVTVTGGLVGLPQTIISHTDTLADMKKTLAALNVSLEKAGMG